MWLPIGNVERGNDVPPVSNIASGLDEFDEEELPPDNEDGLDFATIVRNKLLEDYTKREKEKETFGEFEVRKEFLQFSSHLYRH